MRVDLVTQQRLLALAQKNAAEFKRRLADATAKLERQRVINQVESARAKKKSCAKRKSATAAETPKEAPAEPVESPSPPKKSKKAGPFADVMASTMQQSDPESESDDEVDPSDDEALRTDSKDKKDKAYKGLDSILCAYKDNEINPKDKASELTFEICAKTCVSEIAQTMRWSDAEINDRHHMIISALKMVYKDKKAEWFEQSFLKSPIGAHKYWIKVLKRRCVLWRAAHTRNNPENRRVKEPALSLKQRLREAIKLKKRERMGKSAKASRSSKPAVVVISDSSNSSEGEDEAAAAKAEPESAPAPESYSSSEIKTFGKMAKAIRNADDANGLSQAVADFVDSEFSDNTCVTKPPSDHVAKSRPVTPLHLSQGEDGSRAESALRIMEALTIQNRLQQGCENIGGQVVQTNTTQPPYRQTLTPPTGCGSSNAAMISRAKP